eukprot:566220-Rhodomonas_salina.1
MAYAPYAPFKAVPGPDLAPAAAEMEMEFEVRFPAMSCVGANGCPPLRYRMLLPGPAREHARYPRAPAHVLGTRLTDPPTHFLSCARYCCIICCYAFKN